jgi:hypothetical protein
VAGSYEHGNGPSGSIREREFLDELSDYKLLKKEQLYSMEFGKLHHNEFVFSIRQQLMWNF